MGKAKEVPMRRCCGCMQSKPKAELIRICGGEGFAYIDMEDKGSGRGAYLCRDKKCVESARKKKGIQRSIRKEIRQDILDKLFAEVEEML